MNTAEKDRQTQVLAVFALINVLMEPGWKDMEQVIRSMKSKGFDRCEKTIRRLMKVLKKVGVNILVDRKSSPYTYRVSRARPFLK
jgi:hypothetical protein